MPHTSVIYWAWRISMVSISLLVLLLALLLLTGCDIVRPPQSTPTPISVRLESDINNYCDPSTVSSR
jgi:hypothetical protein